MICRLLITTCLLTIITADIVRELNNTNVERQHSFYSYEDAKNSVIQAEDLLTTGGRLQLNSYELKADGIFLKHKHDELVKGFQDPKNNPASMHFFKAKPLIERSKVFQFLKKMPKGAVLHAHSTATVSSQWVVKNIFYMPGLLICKTKNGQSILSFRQDLKRHSCFTFYASVNDERKAADSPQAYDDDLEKLINLYTPSPELEYSSITKVWSKFQSMFTTIGDALKYLPAYRAFHWQMLVELYNDNIMYAEIRAGFSELYDSNGRIYPVEHSVIELINIIETFKNRYPSFLGVKIIYAVGRKASVDVIEQRFAIFKELHALYPDLIVGFDLVGQEDKGNPLETFAKMLFNKPKTSKFFFHAGETNWYGASSDLNLIDALLLNTTRIGHGYALMKHPILYNAVRTRGIAVEVSPISNQVLELVWDLRNHPGSFFISQNIPIVICNDDPGFWNAKGLSYDFYYAIMSMASSNAGLKTIKQLVWDSIKYSTMQPWERQKAFDLLQKQWDQFIQNVVKGFVV